MVYGRSIRIFLNDGSASGIRHAEIVNWTGQAIVTPRNRVSELSGWEECQRPGVYFLIGEDADEARPAIYVGEAENVFDRIKQHVKDDKKNFDQVLLFTSKDDNLTKAHVKFLESQIVRLIRAVDRVKLLNGNTPPCPALPRSDRVAMDEFLESARLLMVALGFFALHPLSAHIKTSDSSGSGITSGPSGPLANTMLHLVSKRGTTATGISTDEGFVVCKGAVAPKSTLSSLRHGMDRKRKALIENGSVVEEGEQIRFQKDVLFGSPSAAASLVAGCSLNGRTSWRDASGTTLADLEKALIDVE
jgi:hypothetical protein